MTERMRLWTKLAKISFLCRVSGLILRINVNSSDIREGFEVGATLSLCRKEPVEAVQVISGGDHSADCYNRG